MLFESATFVAVLGTILGIVILAGICNGNWGFAAGAVPIIGITAVVIVALKFFSSSEFAIPGPDEWTFMFNSLALVLCLCFCCCCCLWCSGAAANRDRMPAIAAN